MERTIDTITLIDDKEAERLNQVLAWVLGIAGGLIPLDLLIALLLGYQSFLFHAGVMLLIVPFLLAARWSARRTQLRRAVVTLAAGLYVVMILLILIMPMLTATTIVALVMVVALLLPYLEPRQILLTSAGTVVLGIALFLLGTQLPPLVEPLPPLIASLYGALGVSLVLVLTFLLLWQYSTRLLGIITQTRQANKALEEARTTLEETVAARTADLSRALSEVEARAATQTRLLEENSRQREAIREMSVPVMPVMKGAIVIPLIGMLDSQRLQALQDQALQAIERSRARHVLLDITGVPLIDTAVAGGLLAVVRSAQLLGAEVLLVGVRPEVAQTIVALGIDLSSIRTRSSLQEGIAFIADATANRLRLQSLRS